MNDATCFLLEGPDLSLLCAAQTPPGLDLDYQAAGLAGFVRRGGDRDRWLESKGLSPEETREILKRARALLARRAEE